jgi:hypothetical protein
VHCLTFANVDVETAFRYVWLLHFGCFVVFFPFVLATRGESEPISSQLLAQLPGWARVLMVCIFAYALLNFSLFLANSGGGVPLENNGTFLLENHGTVIRKLTEVEYHVQRAYEARGFSGIWLVFYLIPAMYFLVRQPAFDAEA